jgi:anti-sigma regulatory factor (Ser/Thr protein kinase)
VFRDRVTDQAVREFLYAVDDAINRRGYEDLTVDFATCVRAYPEAMLPIAASVDRLREAGIGAHLTLPKDQDLARLFLNSNWAHLLDPDQFDAVDLPHERHLAVRRYVTFQEQQQVVSAALDVIMRNMELQRDVLAGLEWSINEVTDNVLNHANAAGGGFVQVSTFRESHKIHFVVADAGRGIPESMREGFPGIGSDADALMEAVKQGVTRSPDAGQGNGLAGTLRIATGSGGSLKLRSGRAELRVIKPPKSTEYQQDHHNRSPRLAYQGTVVAVELGTDIQFGLEDLLAADGIGHVPWDIVDAAYLSQDGDYLAVRLAEEAGGFGTRQAGQQLRTKLKNLLVAEPTKRVVIDWSGVPLISSSFADEAIGRLFVELGPMGFASRVQHVGMEHLVRSLVDQAVMQRVRLTA